jgi:hypothetical protein
MLQQGAIGTLLIKADQAHTIGDRHATCALGNHT